MHKEARANPKSRGGGQRTQTRSIKSSFACGDLYPSLLLRLGHLDLTLLSLSLLHGFLAFLQPILSATQRW